MKLQIRNYIAQNGERFSLLFDVDHDDSDHAAFPLFYPTAYVTRQLRGLMHNSQVEQLQVIKKLYNWAHSEKPSLDLHQAFLKRQFLKPHQIDSLATFLQVKDKQGNTISRSRFNRSLSVVASYLGWYAREIITDSNALEITSAIDSMEKSIVGRCIKRQGSASRKKQDQLTKRLSDDARTCLLNLFHNPECGLKNPLQRNTRHRNVLALQIMYSTGMRIGEALGLQLQDFISASGGEPAYLVIRRNHDAENDDRVKQPVAKTLGRKLAIDENLATTISDYMIRRSHIPRVGFKDHDPLLVNFRGGSRIGLGINTSNFETSLSNLKKKFPALSEIHPHLLRHDWNYRFSLEAKSRGYTEKQEREIREYCMGWVDDSPSSKIYNRRYIEQLAFEIGLKIANDTKKKV
ncbi:tyrosine-type recombinase/integrase [Aeromonas caviae]|uniref:tyrosine-type recombinase/integrase n=1 Tax=Aeromonas caviae TaxID=648 RepID=UPI000DEAB2EF|nr:tyrosine-type recombinase/integrase [Aeromonas caviae]QLL84104.1 tyrosine-type recombinase/integrase [Aeromonas caviae]RCE17364.1 site-specific integrase [Aeromonas caviae]